jgi:hypothetical protein
VVAEQNLHEVGLARLIRSGFKKGCVLLYFSSSELGSTLTVYWNVVGAAGMSYTDSVIGDFPFFQKKIKTKKRDIL